MVLSSEPTDQAANEPTPTEIIKAKQKEEAKEQQEFAQSIIDFAESATELSQITLVLRNMSRVKLSPEVIATISGNPQDSESLTTNPIQGSMQLCETACHALLKRAFSIATSLSEVNKILTCDYRMAPEGKIDGTLLYNIGERLAECLTKNEPIRKEVIAARTIDEDRNEAFLHFLMFAKTLEARDKIASVLLELQSKAFGQRIDQVADLYK